MVLSDIAPNSSSMPCSGVGLELFLAIEDKNQLFLTTDHPNGASFRTYPHLIRLLMDKSYRDEMLSKNHQAAVAMSYLKDMSQEYSLYDIATITRSGPGPVRWGWMIEDIYRMVQSQMSYCTEQIQTGRQYFETPCESSKEAKP